MRSPFVLICGLPSSEPETGVLPFTSPFPPHLRSCERGDFWKSPNDGGGWLPGEPICTGGWTLQSHSPIFRKGGGMEAASATTGQQLSRSCLCKKPPWKPKKGRVRSASGLRTRTVPCRFQSPQGQRTPCSALALCLSTWLLTCTL